jgi:hypothetical protein
VASSTNPYESTTASLHPQAGWRDVRSRKIRDWSLPAVGAAFDALMEYETSPSRFRSCLSFVCRYVYRQWLRKVQLGSFAIEGTRSSSRVAARQGQERSKGMLVWSCRQASRHGRHEHSRSTWFAGRRGSKLSGSRTARAFQVLTEDASLDASYFQVDAAVQAVFAVQVSKMNNAAGSSSQIRMPAYSPCQPAEQLINQRDPSLQREASRVHPTKGGGHRSSAGRLPSGQHRQLRSRSVSKRFPVYNKMI